MASHPTEICVVSGGAGGLGQAVARRFAEDGAHVVVVDIGEAALQFAGQLAARGFSASGAVCDVSNRAQVDALREGVIKAHGRIDTLICLAGVARNAKLEDVTDEDFDLTLSSHVRGTLNVIRAFAPDMKQRKYGRIVTTSSVAALGSLTATSYSAAKGAIEAMTRTAAIELAKHGIAVNCVAPGAVGGGMFAQQPEKDRQHILSRTPMRRVADPAEVAACYRFLGSREAGFVTGQTLYVCGGASIGAFN